MDIRLEKAGWSGADFWLKRQTASDLAQGRKDLGMRYHYSVLLLVTRKVW